jgi:hypothetical protein
VLGALALTGAIPVVAAPAPSAPYEHAEEYPDAPHGPSPEAVPELVRGGRDEDANWVPFLGNHELWCTNGNPGYSGCRSHHGYPALDIGMPVGTKVYAAGPGTVIHAGSSSDARGTYVEIRHDDRVRSRYYHLSRVAPGIQGTHVERGTLIGWSGMTGRTTSPHLHYEERTASGGQKDPGVMFGTVNGQLRVYPTSTGHSTWWTTPYGTRIRNQHFAVDNTTLYWGGPGVATGDFNGDGADDVVAGTPGLDSGNSIDAGGAHVLYGTPGPRSAAERSVSATGSTAILQGAGGVPGTKESNEVFGAAVATGDFNGDEFDDLAVGAPAATIGGERAAGEVIVLYGSAHGFQTVTSSALLTGYSRHSGDQFGVALAAGDFDGNGYDELAVAAPGRTVDRQPVAGAVDIFNGGPTGLATAANRQLNQSLPGMAGTPYAGDRLGVSLATGDTNGDGVDDLAVGIPGKDLRGPSGRVIDGDSGSVLVVRGRPATGGQPGLRPQGSIELHADSPQVVGDGRAGDQLGISVAMGDVQGDGFDDVVVGIIGRDVARVPDAGAILVLRGSTAGIRAVGSRQFTADSPNVAGAATAGDRLGSSLAVGDMNGDEVDDVLGGVAGKRVNARARAGAVMTLLGSSAGLTGIGSRQFHAGTGTTGLIDQADADDALGASVALGDLDGNGYADPVIATPGEDYAQGRTDAGAVTVVESSASGLDLAGSRIFHGAVVGTPAATQVGARWGGLFPIYLR